MQKSETAVKHGYGSMPYRWVSGLTPGEKESVRRGVPVYFTIHKTHHAQSGYKIVVIRNGKIFDSREPTDSELAEILKKEEDKMTTIYLEPGGMTRIKLVVINEHTLGYIQPETPTMYCTFRASLLKGATFEMNPGPKSILPSDNVRLATPKDFADYRVSFKGYEGNDEYEYDKGTPCTR